ncbi:MAG: HAD family hydrolase [Chloroflexi bacterium]|nr:HAD family hydrolase [Chloroflexota bacterium]
MIQAVTLDFWGTLVDDRVSGAPPRIAVLAAALAHVSRQQVAAAYARAWDRYQRAGAQGLGLSPEALLSLTLDELSEALRPPAFRAVLSAWEVAHVTDPPALLPGVPEVLRGLRRKGLLVALISDTGATPGTGLREYLREQGLHTLFDWLTFSGETGVTKRSPQAFRHTLAALGVRPGDAVHVGDTPATDIAGAQAAGLRAILTLELHDRRAADCRPDGMIHSIRDLPAALDSMSVRSATPK